MSEAHVYNSFDNTFSIQVKVDGVATDFTAVTRMVMHISGSTIVADSDVDAALLTWDAQGVIVCKVGGLGLIGRREVTIVAYDPTNTNGKVVVSPQEHGLFVTFTND